MQKILSNSSKRYPRRFGVWLLLMTALTAVTGCSPQPAPSTATAPGASGQLVVIVHPDNPTASLTHHQVRRIFERKESRWESGKKVIPVDLQYGDPARELFSRTIFDASTDTVRKWWIAEGFQGGARPPPMRSAARVLNLVSHTVGAIGYVPASRLSTKSAVKIVLKLP